MAAEGVGVGGDGVGNEQSDEDGTWTSDILDGDVSPTTLVITLTFTLAGDSGRKARDDGGYTTGEGDSLGGVGRRNELFSRQTGRFSVEDVVLCSIRAMHIGDDSGGALEQRWCIVQLRLDGSVGVESVHFA